MIELLAPAGSHSALVAAVRSGADAVYLGMSDFNARIGAENFDREGLKQACSYCSQNGVKVYLALNTLVADDEFENAAAVLKTACDAGVDGVIVQDIGVAKLVRESCPELPLHASTQMTVHTPGALYLLKELGFSRVVLAREMSGEEISQLVRCAKTLGIQTEVFVHGALCMCVSGQCYFSAVVGQRSANRGMCAQPCRLPYNDGNPLSLKDLSLLDDVRELIALGVDSLKIEGRMKRPEYIASSVSAYRSMIDTSSVDADVKRYLNDVFSRSGHTDGYYRSALGSEMFGIRTKQDVLASGKVINAIHSLYRSERQHIDVDVCLRVCKGQPSQLTMKCGDKTAGVFGDVPEPAASVPLDTDRALSYCSKLGSTPFKLRSFTCDIDGGLTLTASQINKLRRDCTEELLGMMTPEQIPFEYRLPQRARTKRQGGRIFARFSDVSQMPLDLHGTDRVYLPLGSDRLDLDCETGVEIPRVMFGREERIEKQLSAAKERGFEYALCHNIAAVYLARRAGLKVHCGFGMNVFNSYAAAYFDGADDITLSFELTLDKARKIGTGGIIAYGRLPLMITRNCPVHGDKQCASCGRQLRDRRNMIFPVVCSDGYSEILNCKTLMLEREKCGGFDFAGLYFTTESRDECESVLAAYSDGKQIKGDFTRGLYFRGVL